jgi:hypothetical protein
MSHAGMKISQGAFMKLQLIPLCLLATASLSGCTGMMEVQTAYDYNRNNKINYISNYYAGDYYIGEYEIQNTHNGYCSDGFCHKNDDKFRY